MRKYPMVEKILAGEALGDASDNKAEELGTKAFHEGKQRVPATDKALMDLIKESGEGSAMPLMKAWTHAWDAANLAAPVPE